MCLLWALHGCMVHVFLQLACSVHDQEWAHVKEAVGSGGKGLADFGDVVEGLALKCLGRSELGTTLHPCGSGSTPGYTRCLPPWAHVYPAPLLFCGLRTLPLHCPTEAVPPQEEHPACCCCAVMMRRQCSLRKVFA